MSTFSSVLDAPLEKASPPKLLPVGSYLCQITGQPKFTAEVGKNKNPVVEYELTVASAMDDVDREQLAEAGDIRGKKLRATWWLTEDALYRYKDWCTNVLGMDISGKSVREILPGPIGHQIIAHVGHRPYEDRNTGEAKLAADITRYAAP